MKTFRRGLQVLLVAVVAVGVVWIGFGITSLTVASDGRAHSPQTLLRIQQAGHSGLPSYFEANRGQADSRVSFLGRGRGYTLLVTPTEVVLVHAIANDARPRIGSGRQLRMTLIGADPQAAARGRDVLPGKVNYFRGSNPQVWQTNVPTYGRVQVEQAYPGIDVEYYCTEKHLEFDFVVAPSGDPSAIRLGFEGAERLEIDGRGDLVLTLEGGELRLPKPHIYQDRDGVRRAITGGYVPHGAMRVGFQVDAYDLSTPLIVDPLIIYSTYLGGSREEHGATIAVDAAGNAYVAATSDSPGFLARREDEDNDVLIAKLNSSGSALVYATYLGGKGLDRPTGIALDAAGNAYITGSTQSPDFPVVGAMQPALAGDDDVYVAKLDPTARCCCTRRI